MTVHTMSLKEKYFNLIFNKKKTVELRLYDEKRKQIQVGDKIKFVNNTASFEVLVKGLFLARNFEELFRFVPVEKCGFDNKKEALEIMEQFYTKDMQKKEGVVGIIIEKDN